MASFPEVRTSCETQSIHDLPGRTCARQRDGVDRFLRVMISSIQSQNLISQEMTFGRFWLGVPQRSIKAITDILPYQNLHYDPRTEEFSNLSPRRLKGLV